MENLNQSFITSLPYYVLMAVYLATFIFWMELQKIMKVFSKWTILMVIMFLGCATTNNFYAGYNILDTSFLINIFLCMFLILIMRGYMFHISEGYSTQTKTLKEVFNGKACRTNFKDKKEFKKVTEKPLIFRLKFVIIVFIAMVGTRGVWWVDKEISNTKVVELLNENMEVKKDYYDTKKQVIQVKQTNNLLLKKIVTEDSLKLEIKSEK